MNVTDEIDSVIRQVTTNGGSRQVILVRTFGFDAADLWKACTSTEQIPHWFEPVSGDLALGGRYTLINSGTQGAIMRCEPTRHLAITWEYQGDVSRVEIDFEPLPKDRTAVRVCHHVPTDDHWETYDPGAAGVGWEESLRALALYLVGDEKCTPDNIKTFGSTPEGQELTRQGASAWGLADQDTGTSVVVAEARAKRTVEAYLGLGADEETGD